jgi:hypothetical protein
MSTLGKFFGHIHGFGNVWHNWVFINWGDDGGVLPGKLNGFVDLSELPLHAEVSYGGVELLSPSVYAIVETAKELMIPKLCKMLNLFIPICKECGKLEDGYVVDMNFYLADVEGIHSMLVVVPDIGGQSNDYLVIVNI